MPYALLYTLAAFALILVLARIRVPLALAVLAGTVAIGVLFKLPPVELLRALGVGTVQPMTVGVIVIVILLLAISGAMRQAGQLERIVSLFRTFFRRPAVTMAALPALIGLLPMPGGALFSAPMVESAAGDGKTDAAKLSAINYWFRHIWEHWWPLYPGVIVATILTNSNPLIFAAHMIPLGLVMIVSGLLLFRNTHPNLHVAGPRPPAGTKRKLLRATSPIWIILLVWGVATLAILVAFGPPPIRVPGEPPLTGGQEKLALAHRFVPITLGLVVSLFWTIRMNRIGGGAARRIIFSGTVYSLVGLVVSVMVFQHVLKQVDAADGIAQELETLHVPVVLVVAVLPFVAGMVTGLAIGFVGTSFPIVLGLVRAMPEAGTIWPYVALAYAFGHMGQMMSPLHLCHIVSNRYFKTTFTPVYRNIVPPAIVMSVLAIGYFCLLKLLLD